MPFGTNPSNNSPHDFIHLPSEPIFGPFLSRSGSCLSNLSNGPPISPKTDDKDVTFGFLDSSYPESHASASMDLSPTYDQNLMHLPRPRLIHSVSDEMDSTMNMDTTFTSDPFGFHYSPPTNPIKLESLDSSTSTYEGTIPGASPSFFYQRSFRKTIPLKFDSDCKKEFPANWNQTISDLKKEVIMSLKDLSGVLLQPSQLVVRDWDAVFEDRHTLAEFIRHDTKVRTLEVWFKVPVFDEDGVEREVISRWKISDLLKRISQHLDIDNSRVTVKAGHELVDKTGHIFHYMNPNSRLAICVLKKVPAQVKAEVTTPSGRPLIPSAPTLVPSILMDPPKASVTITKRRDIKAKQFPPPTDLVEIPDPEERKKAWCEGCQEEAREQLLGGRDVFVRCNWIRVWRPREYIRGRPRKYYSCNQDGCVISITKDLHAKRSHAHNHTKNFKTPHEPLRWIS